jgi:hypothetical protein
MVFVRIGCDLHNTNEVIILLMIGKTGEGERKYFSVRLLSKQTNSQNFFDGLAELLYLQSL